MRDDGEIEPISNELKCESMPTLKDVSDDEYVVNGESLVIRTSFNGQVSEEDVEQQRDNIFHTRCYITIYIRHVRVLLFEIL